VEIPTTLPAKARSLGREGQRAAATDGVCHPDVLTGLDAELDDLKPTAGRQQDDVEPVVSQRKLLEVFAEVLERLQDLAQQRCGLEGNDDPRVPNRHHDLAEPGRMELVAQAQPEADLVVCGVRDLQHTWRPLRHWSSSFL
jgi:hypothetical protein